MSIVKCRYLLFSSLLLVLFTRPSLAQLFDFYPDLPFSEAMDELIYFRNVLNVKGARDLQEIPDGSGRFLAMRGDNKVHIVSPTDKQELFLAAGPVPRIDAEGSLSLAIHPGFATPGDPGFGKLYTLTIDVDRTRTPDFISKNTGAFSHYVITEWTQNDSSANVFSGTSRELMRFDHGSEFHNTNQILFGPDGYLYIGSGEDLFEVHSSDLSSVYGKILRIDPLGSDSGNGQYGIPPDNPFVGDPEAAGEVFAYGIRNPWRMGFDRETGDLYEGDVGLSSIEEVNHIVAGTNYGWPHKEGSFLAGRPPLDQDLPDPGTGLTLAETLGLTDPLFELDRSELNAVIGTVAYRGQRFPELQGKVIFGSWNKFNIFAGDPETGEVVIIVDGERLREFMEVPGCTSFCARYVSINEDVDGEIYLSGADQVVGLFAKPDFNRMDGFDPSDVDAVCSAIGSRNSRVDLNGDFIVDEADMQMMLEFANSLPGDLDLNGTVEFADFNQLVVHLGVENALWSEGDVNCDGRIFFGDFIELVGNFGESRTSTQVVPESSPPVIALFALVLVWFRRVAK